MRFLWLGLLAALALAASTASAAITPTKIGLYNSQGVTSIGTGTNLVTTADSPPGTLVVVFATINGNLSGFTVTDQVGNTYTVVATITGAFSASKTVIAWGLVSTDLPLGDWIAVNWSTTAEPFVASAAQVTGLNTSAPFDVVTTNATGTGTTPAANALTPSHSYPEIVFGVANIAQDASGDSATPGASFASLIASPTTAVNKLSLWVDYLGTSSTTPVTYTTTVVSTGKVWNANSIAFTGPAVVGGCKLPSISTVGAGVC